MSVTGNKKTFFFAALIAIIAWIALGLQYYILIHNASANGLSAVQVTGRFFGYFTVLTNLLVAISLSVRLLFPLSRAGKFFSAFPVSTAIAVYIFIVGLGYNILLRHLWQPQGLQFAADELLHDIVPGLYVLYWLFLVKKEKLQWKYLFTWLSYPLIYLCYALLRGAIDGWYPYPFINVKEIGYGKLLINATGLLLAFCIVSSLFILIARKIYRY